MSSPSTDWSVWRSRDMLRYWQDRLPVEPWHAGRTVGRTVYKGDGPDDMIGVMDTRDLAAFVASIRNRLPTLIQQMEVLDELVLIQVRWSNKSRLQKLWEVLCGHA